MADFTGFVNKSSTIVSPLLVKDGAGALTSPTAAPSYEVWNATIESTIASGSAVILSTTSVGMYRISVDTTPAGFAAGNSYFLRAFYIATTTPTVNQEQRFSVA